MGWPRPDAGRSSWLQPRVKSCPVTLNPCMCLPHERVLLVWRLTKRNTSAMWLGTHLWNSNAGVTLVNSAVFYTNLTLISSPVEMGVFIAPSQCGTPCLTSLRSVTEPQLWRSPTMVSRSPGSRDTFVALSTSPSSGTTSVRSVPLQCCRHWLGAFWHSENS